MSAKKVKFAWIASCASLALPAGAMAATANLPILAGGLPSIKLPKIPRTTPAGNGASGARTTSSAATDRKEQRRQGDLVKTILDDIEKFRPDYRSFIADNASAEKAAAQQLADFQAKMARTITPEIVRMANDDSNSYTARAAKTADNLATSTSRFITTTDLNKFRNSDGRDDMAIAQYFGMLFRAEQMQQLAALYPGREPITAADQVARNAVAKLGSLGSVKQGRAAANAARVAETRLYPTIRRDAALESQFANAFKSSIWSQQEFAGSQVLKVNLTSSGWTVRRNEITGIILSRDQQANLAVKRKDGKCYSYLIIFEQKHQGSDYGGTYMASGRDIEMLCENIS